MNQEGIITLVQNQDIESLKKLADYHDIAEYVEFYNNSKFAHKVFSRVTKNSDPNYILSNFQKLLVQTLVNFMFAEDVELSLVSGDSELFETLQNEYKRLKFNYFDEQIAKDLFAYSQALESITFDGEIRYTPYQIIENQVYPVYDDLGDLVVLIREYKVKKLTDKGMDDVLVTEVWAKGYFQRYYAGQLQEEGEIGKIPFVLYQMDRPIWYEARDLINRIELLMSGLADVNDYFGRPFLKIEGADEEGITIQKDTVQVITATSVDGQKPVVDFLALKSEPKQLAYELDTLTKMVFKLAHVPDISFENLKGLGNLSGVALRLLFLDTILQARQLFKRLFKFERRINLLKYWLSIKYEDERFKDLLVDVNLGSVLPSDDESLVRQIVQSFTAGIISKETAIEQNPLVSNTQQELNRLESEAGGSFTLETEI